MEGKARILQAVLPALKECASTVEQSGYIAQLSRTMGIEEGIIRQELSNYRGLPEDALQPSRTFRSKVRQVDNAVRRAGRIVIRLAWDDPGVLDDLTEQVPLASFPDALHGEILRYLEQRVEAGETADDASALAVLSEEAAGELSRARVEDCGGADLAMVYDDCVRVLRKAYLAVLYDQHRIRADALQKEGKDFLQELEESKRIKKEMEAL